MLCLFVNKCQRFKASCSDKCSSVANFVKLTSIFETGRDKKAGVDDKTEKKTTFISL